MKFCYLLAIAQHLVQKHSIDMRLKPAFHHTRLPSKGNTYHFAQADTTENKKIHHSELLHSNPLTIRQKKSPERANTKDKEEITTNA